MRHVPLNRLTAIRTLVRVICASGARIGLLTVLFVTTIAGSGFEAYAISPAQTNVFNEQIGFFNTEACNAATASSGASTLNGYTLPADSGKTGFEQPVDANGDVIGGPDNGKPIAFAALAATLPQAYRDYYINMRWTYATWNWDGTSKVVDQAQVSWMQKAPRLVLVTDTKTGKSIIAAALETGPAPWTGVDASPNNTPKEGWTNPENGTPIAYTGRVSGFPPKAISALGATMGMPDGSGDVLTYSWAVNQDAIPGPTTLPASDSSIPICGTAQPGVLGSFVWESQGDPRWANQIICWDAAHGGCDTVANEGCWATSAAMIISTFSGHGWPNPITPMQTEGNGQPPESFSNNNLVQVSLPVNAQGMARAMHAVQQGALVLIHGHGVGPDGGPFYNTPTHWEVIRGVAADGNVYVGDPADMPDPKNEAAPQKNGHTWKEWSPLKDVLPYLFSGDGMTVFYPKGKSISV